MGMWLAGCVYRRCGRTACFPEACPLAAGFPFTDAPVLCLEHPLVRQPDLYAGPAALQLVQHALRPGRAAPGFICRRSPGDAISSKATADSRADFGRDPGRNMDFHRQGCDNLEGVGGEL